MKIPSLVYKELYTIFVFKNDTIKRRKKRCTYVSAAHFKDSPLIHCHSLRYMLSL